MNVGMTLLGMLAFALCCLLLLARSVRGMFDAGTQMEKETRGLMEAVEKLDNPIEKLMHDTLREGHHERDRNS